MYKIAVFTDIHAVLEPLEAIIGDIKKKEFNEVICLGDILSKGPNPKECMDLIIDNNIEMVWGNHEGKAQEIWSGIVPLKKETNGNLYWCMSKMEEKEKEFIMNLKYSITRNIDGKSFLFFHYPFDEENRKFYFHKDLTKEIAKEYFENYNYDYIFFGHHHNEKYLKDGKKKMYNLGSSGCVNNEYTFYYIITIDEGKVTVRKKKIKFDRNKMEKAIRNSDSPNKNHLASVFFNINI